MRGLRMDSHGLVIKCATVCREQGEYQHCHTSATRDDVAC